MKLTNPWSKRRLSRREKLGRFLAQQISRIEIKEQDRNNLLSCFYWSKKGSILNKGEVSIPKGTEVDLLSIAAAEIVPVEKLVDLKNGLKKLIHQYRPELNINNLDYIDEFCDNVASNIHGNRWSNLGYIKFRGDTEIGSFIDRVNIQATQVTSSIVVVNFLINPSSKYLSNLTDLIQNNVKGELIFKPKIKGFFKYWNSSTLPPEIVKRRMLEDQILELKWKLFNTISDYIPAFFYKNNIVAPSLLLYRIKQKSDIPEKNYFWPSVGLKNGRNYSLSEDKMWYLHEEYFDGLDDSLNILYNASDDEHFEKQNVDFIIHKADDFVRSILPMLTVKRYTLFISEKIALFRVSSYNSMSIKKINYKNIINLRLELERDIHMFNRIKDEFEADYNYYSKLQTESFDKLLFEYTVNLINKTDDHAKSLTRQFDSTIQLATLQTNFSLQRKTVALTIATIFLALVAIYLTYYQISHNTTEHLFDFWTKY
ncbi:hypothetical protein [Paenibacillus sp. USHLN196]|uniref:hypothetical protein n=1 Tax=Paenibacillus sp. USHLN196 TaxID=3081291 RepID=UPI0030176095